MQHNWKISFLTMVGGQTVSLIGSSAVSFCIIWWLATETGSPLIMSLAGLLAYLPQFLLGPFAGVWIDRLPRKTVIIAADIFAGLAAALYAVWFYVNAPPYWAGCVVLAVRAIGGVFHTPAVQAAVPLLVPKGELVRANGLGQFIQLGAYMLGPVLGASLYAALPLPIILLTDLAGAIAASAAVSAVKIPEVKTERRAVPNVARELKEGWAVYLSDRRLCTVTLAMMICMVFFMPICIFYTLMSSDYFEVSAWHAGLVEVMYAGGMMASAAVMGSLKSIKNKLGIVQMGLAGLGIVCLLAGLLPQTPWGFWVFAGLCMLMGAAANVYNIPYTAYLQATMPPEALGRAFSLFGSLMSVTMPVGLVVAAPVADKQGVASWFVVAGAAIMLTTAAGAVVRRPQRAAQEA
jgi:DHA3 family macrolide efflux protein-like MFS transporter